MEQATQTEPVLDQPEEAEEHAESHAPPAGGHGHGRGGGHAEGHGGHSCRWIVTYSDMITLLMACFIMIITFSSKEPDRYGKKLDSVLYGTGGVGIAGSSPSPNGMDRDSFLWRYKPPSSRLTQVGSDMPPLYSDPVRESTAEVVRALDRLPVGTLADSYTLCVPLALLFGEKGKLSPAGAELLHSVAASVRFLPYDLHVQINDAANIPRGVVIARYLSEKESIHPGRLAVGVRDGAGPWRESVWLVYARQP